MISLVVATYGRASDLDRLFNSLVAQTCKEFEVIVVDQNTDDRVVPHVEAGRAAGLSIRHARLSHPSLSGARNLGITLARHDVVAFPDDDCWYDRSVIETVTAAYETEPVDCVVAEWVEQVRGADISPHVMSRQQWRRFRGGHASSISLFARRELLLRLEGFDDRFGVGRWYGAAEETDLVLRALDSGASLVYCPAAKVHHHFHTGPADEVPMRYRKARSRARGTGALYAKHRLPLVVILRGLLAPALLPMMRLSHPAVILGGVSTSLGRLEGYLRWLVSER